MDLALDPSIGSGYRSPSQKARVITEHWATHNLFCPACPSNSLRPLPPNEVVADFRCPNCRASFQLKSSSQPFGKSVSNSEYHRKLEAIQEGRAPHYVFLRYFSKEWVVIDLFIVPGHFFSPAVIQERAPLGPNARRKGWVGSNILLTVLPADARIEMVAGGQCLHRAKVREAWNQFAFLGARNARGGWGADMLICIRELQRTSGSNEFSSQDFYGAFESRLGELHPDNLHIQDKIRQQLQRLRDNGVLEFLGRGRYRILK